MDDVIDEKNIAPITKKTRLLKFIILFSVLFILVVTLMITSFSLSNNAIPPTSLPQMFSYGFLGSDFVILILFKSAVNLLIYMPVVFIPTFILEFYKIEKEMDSMWIWAVPLISIVGAYIYSQVAFNNIGYLFGMVLNLLLCLTIMLLMDNKLITGIIVGILVTITNIFFQMYVTLSSDHLFWVMMVAIVISIFITAMFLNNTRQILMRSKDVNRSDYLRQLISYSITCLLLLYVFMI